MKHDIFREKLEKLGISQTGFARIVSDLAGEPFSHRTVQAWASPSRVEREAPAPVAALLTMIERHGVEQTLEDLFVDT